jgi:D-alanine-D-alanine ligase
MTKVAIAYNLIKPELLLKYPLDRIAEFDSLDTIQEIANALIQGGHEVIFLEVNTEFVHKLTTSNPEIVFNIAEGVNGECREAQVPAICDFFGIPYTGSGVLTLSTCLNKARTNDLLSCHGVIVPPSQVMHASTDFLQLTSEFPWIVKLLHEGSSMGLSRKSVVFDEQSLRQQVDDLITAYHEPVLVQKFITGREFTLGILGNQNPFPLPITEIVFEDPLGIVMYYPDDDILPLVKQIKGEQFVNDFFSQVFPKKTVCPADISPQLAERINQVALKAFQALECRDWCRIDLRLGSDDCLYVLELNPIAGIAPGYWLPKSAEAAQMDYAGFVNKILDIAWERVHGSSQ